MTSPGQVVGRNALDPGNSPALMILNPFILIDRFVVIVTGYNKDITETLVGSVQYFKIVDMMLHTSWSKIALKGSTYSMF